MDSGSAEQPRDSSAQSEGPAPGRHSRAQGRARRVQMILKHV